MSGSLHEFSRPPLAAEGCEGLEAGSRVSRNAGVNLAAFGSDEMPQGLPTQFWREKAQPTSTLNTTREEGDAFCLVHYFDSILRVNLSGQEILSRHPRLKFSHCDTLQRIFLPSYMGML